MSKSAGKHVVIVTRVFNPEPAIAAEIQYSFAKTLADADYSVTVLTTEVPGHTMYHDGKLDVRRWPAFRNQDGYIRGILQYLSFDIPLFFRLLFHAPKPDVVLVEPPPTTAMVVRIVCWLRRVPYVYRVADLWSEAVTDEDTGKLVQRLLRVGEIWALRGAKSLISVHQGITSRLVKLHLGNPIKTVGMGVDIDLYSPDREPLAHLPAKRILLYAGTASHVHGAEIFVDAFNLISKDFPDTALVFIGQGTSYDWIQKEAKKSNGRIIVLPRVSSREAAAWLRTSVASLASVKPGSYEFAFPTKAYASVACGTPVIYTGAVEAGKIIADNNLGWFAEYTVESVAEAMRAVLNQDISITDKQKNTLRQWATANISLAVIANKVKEIVDSVVFDK